MCLFTVSPITEAHFKISWSRGVNESKSFNIITDINILNPLFLIFFYYLPIYDVNIYNKLINFFFSTIHRNVRIFFLVHEVFWNVANGDLSLLGIDTQMSMHIFWPCYQRLAFLKRNTHYSHLLYRINLLFKNVEERYLITRHVHLPSIVPNIVNFIYVRNKSDENFIELVFMRYALSIDFFQIHLFNIYEGGNT